MMLYHYRSALNCSIRGVDTVDIGIVSIAYLSLIQLDWYIAINRSTRDSNEIKELSAP